MIPKTIHYCWFGGAEKPPTVIRYINLWRRVMPDYVIKEWNETNFDISRRAYTREAYALRNYAFVADVCRLEALWTEGGIYLDTDIEVLSRFDKFLHLHSFLGREHNFLGTGCIGAEAGSRWVKIFLDYYSRHHFINFFGHMCRTPNTKLLTVTLWPRIPAEERPIVFDFDYFCAKRWDNGEVQITPCTVCVHHFSCSWTRGHKTLAVRLYHLLLGLRVRYNF